MNYGAHLSTLIAVIVGLAVTELLAGASRTLRGLKSAGFSWLPFAQAILIATIIVVFWIASYAELESGKYLSIVAFASQLIAPSLLYFAATRVFPPAEGASGASVCDHVIANARDVNVPPALWMVCTIIGNLYYFWPNPKPTLGPNLFCLFAIAAFLTAAWTRRGWIRWTATLLAEASIVLFIAIYIPAKMA